MAYFIFRKVTYPLLITNMKKWKKANYDAMVKVQLTQLKENEVICFFSLQILNLLYFAVKYLVYVVTV